ncbi:aegerolysin type hemolysin, partial [Kalaharituber pfeilii]
QAYSQWIALRIRNRSAQSVFITGINLEWGKLYDGDDMDNEVNPGTIIGREIRPKKSTIIYSCGRENASSGTEGTVTVSERRNGANRVVAIYWDCPW